MIEKIPLNRIECLEQIRGHVDQDIEGLTQSIREVGLLQPISARREGDRIITVDGARRCAAAERAGLDEIEVNLAEQPLSEAEATLRQFIANVQRLDLTPLENADSLVRIKEQFQCSITDLATKTGLTVTKVSNLLALRSLPEEIIARVESGEIPSSTAIELARIADPTHQRQLADEAAAGRLTRDEVARKIRAARRNKRCETTSKCEVTGGLKRATAVLGPGRLVTVTGTDLTLERVVEWLEELLASGRKALRKGIGLSAFLRMIKEQGGS